MSKLLKQIREIDTIADLNKAIDAINAQGKFLRSNMTSAARRALKPGMRVVMPSSKKLAGRIGELIELRRTKATVSFEGERWTVPISMLKEA